MALGDSIALSPLLRDLKAQYPEIQLGVSCAGGDELYRHDSDLVALKADQPGVEVFRAYYRNAYKASQSGVPLFFSQGFFVTFNNESGLGVKCLDPKPHLVLTEEEKAVSPLPFRYWLINAGGKQDMLVKIWPARRYQQVVDQTRREINWVQIGLKHDSRFPHLHPELTGVTSLVGQTSIRDLMRLVYHSDGVLCPVTAVMLIAQAFEKPCVVVAGGREEWWWQAYCHENPALSEWRHLIRVPHRYLHSIGKFDCCEKVGCHCCSIVAPHNDSKFPDGFFCQRPCFDPGGVPVGECLWKLSPEEVVAAVRSYKTL